MINYKDLIYRPNGCFFKLKGFNNKKNGSHVLLQKKIKKKLEMRGKKPEFSADLLANIEKNTSRC